MPQQFTGVSRSSWPTPRSIWQRSLSMLWSRWSRLTRQVFRSADRIFMSNGCSSCISSTNSLLRSQRSCALDWSSAPTSKREIHSETLFGRSDFFGGTFFLYLLYFSTAIGFTVGPAPAVIAPALGEAEVIAPALGEAAVIIPPVGEVPVVDEVAELFHLLHRQRSQSRSRSSHPSSQASTTADKEGGSQLQSQEKWFCRLTYEELQEYFEIKNFYLRNFHIDIFFGASNIL